MKAWVVFANETFACGDPSFVIAATRRSANATKASPKG